MSPYGMGSRKASSTILVALLLLAGASGAVARERTLAVDVGGTAVKMAVVGPRGGLIGRRHRFETPHPAGPATLLRAIREEAARLGPFDRVSIGFPSFVKDGVTGGANQLQPDEWVDFPLARAAERELGRPTRVVNDADMHALGAIHRMVRAPERHDLILVVTLGTGLGLAAVERGELIPNFTGKRLGVPARGPGGGHGVRSFEPLVMGHVRAAIGNAAWNSHLRRVLGEIDRSLRPDLVLIAGGNARHVEQAQLSEHVKLVDDAIGLRGGAMLWRARPRDGDQASFAGRMPTLRKTSSGR